MNFTNAMLVEIARPGPLTGNGDPGEPVQVWSGRVAGYLKRTRRQVISGGISVNIHRDVFTLLRTQGAPVVEEAGGDWSAYTVILEDNRTPTTQRRRFTVRGMENRAAGTPVDSIRLELDTEAAA
jgi:hypothetical protein